MQQPAEQQLQLQGLLLVVLVAAWLAGILLTSFVSLPLFAVVLLLAISILLLVACWPRQRYRLAVLMLLCMLAGGCRYLLSTPGNDPHALVHSIGPKTLELHGIVSEEPKFTGRARLLRVQVDGVRLSEDTDWMEVHGELSVQVRGEGIEDVYGANYGDIVELSGKLQAPTKYDAATVQAAMIFPLVTVDGPGGNPLIAWCYHLRVFLATLITRSLPQPAAALLIAILLSLRTPALQPLLPAFNSTGVAHLIAPSGFKVTILAGLVSRSLSAFRLRQQGRVLPGQRHGARAWLATLLVILSIGLYTLLSGAGPAALRAGYMGSLLALTPRLGRRYNVYTALAFSAGLLSLIDPLVLWDAGFQLSFLGTLGIVLLTPYFQLLLRPLERLPYGHTCTEVIAVTLAAQTATLPIFAVTFQQVSLVAPLTNLLTVPLLSTLLLAGLLLCAVGYVAPLALLAGWLIWPLLWYVQTVVIHCAQLPAASLPVGSLDSSITTGYYLCLAFIVYLLARRFGTAVHQPAHAPEKPTVHATLTPRSLLRIYLALAPLILLATAGAEHFVQPDQSSITFLSLAPAHQAPQGDAIVLRTTDRKTVLIDGGQDATALSQALDQRLPPWQHTLDAVLLTVPMPAHLNGLLDILDRYTVKTVIDAGMAHPSATYARWRRIIRERNIEYLPVKQGMVLSIGSQIRLEVAWPTALLHSGTNEVRDNTLIIRIVMPRMRLLLVGTAIQSSYALKGLLSTMPPGSLAADVVQVEAEGDTPLTETELHVIQQLRPAFLIMTPAHQQSTKKRPGTGAGTTVQLTGCQILNTARLGTLEFTSGTLGIKFQVS